MIDSFDEETVMIGVIQSKEYDPNDLLIIYYDNLK